MVLPRRLLIFTKSQMHFECNRIVCKEVLEGLHNSSQVNLKRRIFKRRLGSCPYDVFVRLEEFYPRTLSLQTDYIKAIVGLFNTSNGQNRLTQFYGLPCFANVCDEPTGMSLFTTSLFWNVARKEVVNYPLNIDHRFPSWAWASIKCAQKPTLPGRISFIKWLSLYCVDLNVQVFNSLGIKANIKTCLDSI